MSAGVPSAISIKLASSIDDVIWLAPFLTCNESRFAKARNATIYVCVCLLQTLIANLIAAWGDAIVEKLITPGAWSTDRILTTAAGVLMALYAMKLGYDAYKEAHDSKEQVDVEAFVEASNTTGTQPPTVTSREGEPDGTRAQSEAMRSRTLFTIAFLGSLDDLTLFVPMLLGNEFDAIQLVIGSFIAASFIVLLCVFIGLCRPVASCLSAVPLVLIVSAFAVVLLTKGIFFGGR